MCYCWLKVLDNVNDVGWRPPTWLLRSPTAGAFPAGFQSPAVPSQIEACSAEAGSTQKYESPIRRPKPPVKRPQTPLNRSNTGKVLNSGTLDGVGRGASHSPRPRGGQQKDDRPCELAAQVRWKLTEASKDMNLLPVGSYHTMPFLYNIMVLGP